MVRSKPVFSDSDRGRKILCCLIAFGDINFEMKPAKIKEIFGLKDWNEDIVSSSAFRTAVNDLKNLYRSSLMPHTGKRRRRLIGALIYFITHIFSQIIIQMNQSITMQPFVGRAHMQTVRRRGRI